MFRVVETIHKFIDSASESQSERERERDDLPERMAGEGDVNRNDGQEEDF